MKRRITLLAFLFGLLLSACTGAASETQVEPAASSSSAEIVVYSNPT